MMIHGLHENMKMYLVNAKLSTYDEFYDAAKTIEANLTKIKQDSVKIERSKVQAKSFKPTDTKAKAKVPGACFNCEKMV